ncbi:MAG: hypothetical protein WA996_07820 [Candidatus Promineifilaceae bacterium]
MRSKSGLSRHINLNFPILPVTALLGKKYPGFSKSFSQKPGFRFLASYALLRRATNSATAKTNTTLATLAMAHLPAMTFLILEVSLCHGNNW